MKKIITIALLFGINHAMAQQEMEPVPEQGISPIDTLTQEVLVENEQEALPYDINDPNILMDTIPLTDGFYQANNLEDAVPFAYPAVNMKNIRFYKRVWRDIDLSNEENYIYAIPGASLIEAVMNGINEGKLTPYSPEDDSFQSRMTASQGVAQFADSVLVPIFDDEGNQIDAQMTLNEFNPERITKFRIKEDIFFDKQRGRLETRIIGVAPLMDISTSAELAESVGSTPAFWLYFPQLRYALVKVDVSDPDRGIYDMSMDDLFVQRKFASTIIRESSPSAMRQEALYAETAEEQAQDAQQIEDKLEAYKERLWSTPRGINPEELEHYQPPVQRQNSRPATSNPSSTTTTSAEEDIRTVEETEFETETESEQNFEPQQQPNEAPEF